MPPEAPVEVLQLRASQESAVRLNARRSMLVERQTNVDEHLERNVQSLQGWAASSAPASRCCNRHSTLEMCKKASMPGNTHATAVHVVQPSCSCITSQQANLAQQILLAQQRMPTIQLVLSTATRV